MSSLVDRIEQVILSQKLTFNRVEHDCGFGNGTIKRWSTQSPRLDKLVAVAQYLNISLDYIVFGTLQSEKHIEQEQTVDFEELKNEQGLICDNSPLEEDEADLVAMFRLLPSYEREDLFDLVYFKYKKHVERKTESIYSLYTKDSSSRAVGLAEGDGNQGGIT